MDTIVLSKQTMHEALWSLLSTLRHSGKLARWRMLLQGMHIDLVIVHQSGKKSANAGALFRCPLSTSADETSTCGIVVVLAAESEPTSSGSTCSEMW